MPYLKKIALCPEPIDCKILTAALSLIVNKGYQRVSIHDIQKLSNVSIGSIYNHFGGKEGVATALYKHIINEFDELIDDALQTNASSSEQCSIIIKQLFEYTETHSDIIAFLFHTKHADFISENPSLYSSKPFLKINTLVSHALQHDEIINSKTHIVVAGLFGGAIYLIQQRLDGVTNEPLMNDCSSLTRLLLPITS